MYTNSLLAAAALLPGLLVSATTPPSYSGYTLIWNDTFAGAAGTPPSANNWKTITGYLNQNSESEVYSSSTKNLQLSGGGSLQLIPIKDPGSTKPIDGWTSGRVETIGGWLPTAGQKTKVEGRLRTGGGAASTQQGIWPAFWLLGASYRSGTKWPACGELDILELRNGVATAFGTAHCGDNWQGGVCNEPSGKGAQTPVTSPSSFHTWSITWDRTSSDFRAQTIEWALDQKPYFSLKGSQLDEVTWRSLAGNSFNIILNVAVGGDFPGAPNAATQGGTQSMLEVQYVAVYMSQ